MAQSDGNSASANAPDGAFEDTTPTAPTDDEMNDLAETIGEDAPPPADPSPGPILARDGFIGEVMEIEAADIQIPEELPTELYWCGVTDDCPLHVVTVVIDFPRGDGPTMHDTKGGVLPPHAYGRIHELTPDQVKEIMRRVSQKIVRFTGKRSKVLSLFKCPGGGSLNLEPVKDDRHRAAPSDVPLGCFLYMIRLDPGFEPARAAPPKGIRLVKMGR